MATIPPIVIKVEGMEELEKALASAREIIDIMSPQIIDAWKALTISFSVLGREIGKLAMDEDFIRVFAQCTPSRNAITDDSILVENWPQRELVEVEK